MKKNKVTEIIIATILIVSLASSYKYYIGDKINPKTNISIKSSDSSNTKDQLMKLEKDDFIKTQVVGLNQPLTVYGSAESISVSAYSADKFQFEFSNFRILDQLPIELLKEKYLVFPNAYKEDGTLKKENTCIAKVDFKITNKNNKMSATMTSGLKCYHIDNQYDNINSNTNEGSIFFASNIGKDDETSNHGVIKLHPEESYSDTVYFIIDKVTEGNSNLVIKVAPFGDNSQNSGGKSVPAYGNGYGLIKVNYSDIIWE